MLSLLLARLHEYAGSHYVSFSSSTTSDAAATVAMSSVTMRVREGADLVGLA
jgi:hypothetical protein